MVAPDIDAVLPAEALVAHKQVNDALLVEAARNLAGLLTHLGIEDVESPVKALVVAVEGTGLTDRLQLATDLAGAAAVLGATHPGLTELSVADEELVAAADGPLAETVVSSDLPTSQGAGAVEESATLDSAVQEPSGSTDTTTDSEATHEASGTPLGRKLTKVQRIHFKKMFSEGVMTQLEELDEPEVLAIINGLVELHRRIEFSDPRLQRTKVRNGEIFKAFLSGQSLADIAESFTMQSGSISHIVGRISGEFIPRYVDEAELAMLVEPKEVAPVSDVEQEIETQEAEQSSATNETEVASATAEPQSEETEPAQPAAAATTALPPVPQAHEAITVSETFEQAVRNLKIVIGDGYTGYDNAFRALYSVSSPNLRMTTEIEELIEELTAKFTFLDKKGYLDELDTTEREALELHWGLKERSHPLSMLSVRGRMSKVLEAEHRKIEAVMTSAIDKFIAAERLQRKQAS